MSTSEIANTRAEGAGRGPLLATKFFAPRARQNLVLRPRLLARLDESSDRGLALISAPAGFGKTTLVGAWLRGLNTPAAWLSLDEADNDPARFLSYLLGALQRVDPTLGQDVRAELETSEPPRLEAAIAALINDLLARPRDFVLVLDDFQVIDEAIVHDAIRTLVAQQPPQMRLVIVTREDPPLPLARLRAQGRLVELRAQDLRFTLDEERSFLAGVMGLALDARDMAALDARIEGWIAGLQLAGLSLQKHVDPAEFIAGLSGNQFYILGYLTEEVLRGLPPDLQSFLLETSVLSRLSGSLCEALTGRADSESVLQHLYAANVFVIPLDDEHSWYRYHHLFADLLRSQLDRAQPQLAPVLQARASEWYERQGGFSEAVDYALAAEDYPRAVRLLEAHGREIVLQGYARTIENWLRRLPQAWRLAEPRANLAFAWSLLLRGRLDDIEPYLRDAEAAAAARADAGAAAEAGALPAEARALLAEAGALRAGLVSLRGEPERGCELARAALRRAPPDDPYLQGQVRFALATAYNYAGRVVEAIESYREALPYCQASGNALASMLIVSNLAFLYRLRGELHAAADLCLRTIETAAQGRTSASPSIRSPALATVYGAYTELLYEWGELEGAQREGERLLALGKQGGHVAALTYGGILLSRIRQAQGELADAQAALEQAAQQLRYAMPAWVASQVRAQQVALALAQDDAAAAAEALAGSGVTPDDPTSYSTEVVHLAYLRLLLHQGRTAPGATDLPLALDLAGRLLDSAEPAGRMSRVIETLALRALVYAAQGCTEAALVDLTRALSLAEPAGFLRVFVDEGAPMAALLRAAHARGMRAPYVARLLAVFPDEGGTAHPAQEGLLEPLGERELEVLRLLAEGLTYGEIAARLVVSLNTVRFHVKNIYGKLGVDRRVAAVDRAKVLGLL